MTTSLAPPPLPSTAPGPDGAGPMAMVKDAGPTRPLARLRQFATTTPGRLRVQSVIVVILAVAAGLVSSFVVADRLTATGRIGDEAVPAIVAARQVQTNLAEANAAVANSFLAGGEEDPGQRLVYEESLAGAADAVETAARLTGDDDEAHAALAQLNAALVRYAGLIETARANNRQGFPVGAAYLNAASRVLEDEISPATDLVANRAAARYRDDYDQQRNLGLAFGALALGLTGLLIVYLVRLLNQLRRRFRRTVNLPMALALAVAAALGGWLVFGLSSHTSHLAAARTDGYQGTRLYLDIRSAGFGAKADEARFLIARGAGESFEDRFGARITAIEPTWDDLLSQAAASSEPGAEEAARAALDAWTAYQAVHDGIVQADRAGSRELAVEDALDAGNVTFAAFDEATAAGLELNRSVFRSEMDQAGQALAGLRYGSLVAVLVVALAAAFGLQQRINEYR